MSPRTRSSTPRVNLLLSALALFAVAPSALAIGDFPCAGSTDSQSCAAWSTDAEAQGEISASAVCQPDPINPSISYCGYANAACTKDLDCDYGSCGSDGVCKGYLGDPCPNGDNDCQAFFFCGTDKTCGGVGAACNNGDPTAPIPSPKEQCTSQTCNETTKICAAPPSKGMPNGFGCGSNDVCESGFCSDDFVCALAASAASRNKVKRAQCPADQLACSFGEGYECIDAKTNLEQCGGCTSDGQGQDCTAIFGVESVTCEQGRCVVVSCVPELQVSGDETSCVL
ncbi:hypothetical protein JCM16303_001601 [Sporobolomyces ruberrimus]